MPDGVIKQMDLVIRTSGSRGRSVQAVRSCYAYGLESPKRPRIPYSSSLGFNTPSSDTFTFSDTGSDISSDKKSAQKAQGELL
jgi:hypothetical protein